MNRFKVNVDDTGFRPSYRISERYRNEDCCGFIAMVNNIDNTVWDWFDKDLSYINKLTKIWDAKTSTLTIAIFKIKLKPGVTCSAS